MLPFDGLGPTLMPFLKINVSFLFCLSFSSSYYFVIPYLKFYFNHTVSCDNRSYFPDWGFRSFQQSLVLKQSHHLSSCTRINLVDAIFQQFHMWLCRIGLIQAVYFGSKPSQLCRSLVPLLIDVSWYPAEFEFVSDPRKHTSRNHITAFELIAMDSRAFSVTCCKFS